MRREVYGRLQRLPVNYFDQRVSGDLMTRVIEDANTVERLQGERAFDILDSMTETTNRIRTETSGTDPWRRGLRQHSKPRRNVTKFDLDFGRRV